jgi:hypothetical protein
MFSKICVCYRIVNTILWISILNRVPKYQLLWRINISKLWKIHYYLSSDIDSNKLKYEHWKHFYLQDTQAWAERTFKSQVTNTQYVILYEFYCTRFMLLEFCYRVL